MLPADVLRLARRADRRRRGRRSRRRRPRDASRSSRSRWRRRACEGHPRREAPARRPPAPAGALRAPARRPTSEGSIATRLRDRSPAAAAARWLRSAPEATRTDGPRSSDAPRGVEQRDLTRADAGRRSDDSPPPAPPDRGVGPLALPRRCHACTAALVVASASVDSPTRPTTSRRGAAGPALRRPSRRAPSSCSHRSMRAGSSPEAIARRATGALCFENEGVVRRVVIRDGDLVAAASGGEHESLVHFLAARGELSARRGTRGSPRRSRPTDAHAGAALVAHGWLRQDQLWVVLRAPCRMDRLGDPPLAAGARRSSSPIRRAVCGVSRACSARRPARRSSSSSSAARSPRRDALERLGGEGTKIAEGPNHGLLAECNLPPAGPRGCCIVPGAPPSAISWRARVTARSWPSSTRWRCSASSRRSPRPTSDVAMRVAEPSPTSRRSTRTRFAPGFARVSSWSRRAITSRSSG